MTHEEEIEELKAEIADKEAKLAKIQSLKHKAEPEDLPSIEKTIAKAETLIANRKEYLAGLEQDVKSITESGKNHSKKEKSVKNKKKSRDKKTVKPTKEHEQPKEKKEETKSEIKHKLKKTDLKDLDKLNVGEKAEDKDGNVIKRTSEDVYILEYHKNKNEGIAFNKKGDKWIVDCCTKRGIEFNASEIDNAVEYIIEGLDCHYELEKRKERNKKRKESRKKYESKSEATKIKDAIKDTAESIENRVEELKEEGRSFTEKQGKDIIKKIDKIFVSIAKGYNEENERKSFIKALIALLQKEL